MATFSLPCAFFWSQLYSKCCKTIHPKLHAWLSKSPCLVGHRPHHDEEPTFPGVSWLHRHVFLQKLAVPRIPWKKISSVFRWCCPMSDTRFHVSSCVHDGKHLLGPPSGTLTILWLIMIIPLFWKKKHIGWLSYGLSLLIYGLSYIDM